MQSIFATEGLHRRNRFNIRRDMVAAQGLPMALSYGAEKPFEARIEAARIGSLEVARYAQNADTGETAPAKSWRYGNDGALLVALPLTGAISSLQNDRCKAADPEAPGPRQPSGGE